MAYCALDAHNDGRSAFPFLLRSHSRPDWCRFSPSECLGAADQEDAAEAKPNDHILPEKALQLCPAVPKGRPLIRILRQDETRMDIECKAKLPDAEGLPGFGLNPRG